MPNNLKDHLSTWYATTVICLVALIIVTAFPSDISKLSAEETATTTAEHIADTTNTVTPFQPLALENHDQTEPQDPFSAVHLLAKSAYVYDVTDQKVLYSSHATDAMPLASLTKIMTAITALDIGSTTIPVTIQKDDLAEDGDSGLYLGEQWNLIKLLQYTLVVSSNDGAAAISEAVGSQNISIASNSTTSRQVFVASMNAEANKIGLTNTVFYNETGLDLSADHAGAYGSARDVAAMLLYGIDHHRDIFTSTSEPHIQIVSENGLIHNAYNTDILASKISGLIAGKTGYTDLAGGNLAINFTTSSGHKIVIVVLGSTYDGRFTDVDALAAATENVIRAYGTLSINQR